MDKLKDLHNREDWASLKTNVGNAAHVPDALIALLSNDEKEVERAYWKIDNYVVLQGELSESAKYLPEYLAETLLEAKFKERVIELLFQIGNGTSSDKELEDECRQKVIRVLENAIKNKDIAETNLEIAIREDILDLKEQEN